MASDRHTFAIALQRAGYQTAMMGKYLNGFMAGVGPRADGAALSLSKTYIPPGLNDWDVAGWGYPEFNRPQPERPCSTTTAPAVRLPHRCDRAQAIGSRPAAQSQQAVSSRSRRLPLTALQPGSRDANDFPGLRPPVPPLRRPEHPPARWFWAPGLTRAQIAKIDADFRLRAQAVQAVDRMIGRIEEDAGRRGLGRQHLPPLQLRQRLHIGDHRLMPGKADRIRDRHRRAADRHRARRPRGSGSFPRGMTENIDLRLDVRGARRGARRPRNADGHSLVGAAARLWPVQRPGAPRYSWSIVAPEMSKIDPGDPYLPTRGAGNPPSYEATRTPGRACTWSTGAGNGSTTT